MANRKIVQCPTKNDKCSVLTSKGVVCGIRCIGPACGIHKKAYERENPTSKLPVPDTQTTKDMLAILDKLRSPEGIAILNQSFIVMFVSRKIFDPAVNANKFVTGGLVEDIISEVLPKIGYSTTNVAATKKVIDIEIKVPESDPPRTIGVSLKNSGSIDQQPILENYRGESKEEIRKLPPTLIIYTETKAKRARIVYIDNDIIEKAYPGLTEEQLNAEVYNKKDSDKQSSLSFRSGFLKGFIPKLPDSYIVNAVFPESIPKVEKKSITLLALEYVRSAIERAPKDKVEAPSTTEDNECFDCGESACIKGDDGNTYCESCWN